MKYVTVELQTMQDGTVANITTCHDTRAKAESAYHTVLAAAAQSGLPAHACVLLDSDGNWLAGQCYGTDES